MAQQAADAVMRAYRVAGFTCFLFRHETWEIFPLKVEVLMSTIDKKRGQYLRGSPWFNSTPIRSLFHG